MIFKTFDSDIDKFSAKIGIFGKSFSDIGIAINDAFEACINNIDDLENNVGFFESLKNNLFPSKESIKDKLIDVDSVLPEIDESKASSILSTIQSIEDGTNAEIKSFQDLYDTGTKQNQWIAEYGQSTTGQIRSTNGVIQANTNARASAMAYNAELKATTISAKAAAVGMKALSVAGNMIAMWAISEAISFAVEAWDNYVNRVDNAKEALDDFNSSIQSGKDNLSSQSEWIKEHGDKYAELAKGVDEYGHNVSLTADEFSDYNSITKDIAEMFPNMVSGYNDQNKAIIKNKGSIDALTESYEKNAKAYYADIRAKSSGTFDEFKTATSEDSDGVDTLNKLFNGDSIKYKTYHNEVFGSSSKLLIDGKDYKDELKNILDDDTFNKLASEVEEKFGESKSFDFSKLSIELQQKIRDFYATANTTIDSESEKVRPILEAYLYGDTSGYNSLDSDAQTAVKTFIQNVDSSFFERFDNDTDMESWLRTNVIQPLQDGADNSDIAIKVQTLFSISEDDYKNYQDYVNAVTDIINSLAKEKGTDGKNLYTKEQLENLKSKLGVSNVNSDGSVGGQSLIDTTKDKFKNIDGADKYISSLSKKKLKVLYTFEPDEATTLFDMETFVNGKLSPKASKKATDITESFSKAWSSIAKFTDKDGNVSNLQTDLLKLAKAGKLTPDVIKSNEDYNQIVKDTGLSTKDVCAEIKKRLTLEEKLATISKDTKKVSSAYKDYKKNGYVSSNSLNSMPDSFKTLDGYKNFSDIAGNKKSKKKDVQKAFNDIVSEYISASYIINDVTEKNKDKVITALSNAGISNAEKLVNSYLETNTKTISDAEKEIEKMDSKDLDHYISVLNQKGELSKNTLNQIGKANGILITQLGGQYKADMTNWIKLLKKKVNAYNKFVKSVNGKHGDSEETTEKNYTKTVLGKTKSKGESKYSQITGAAASRSNYRKAKGDSTKAGKKVASDLKEANIDFSDVSYSPTSPSGSGSSSKKSKEIIDWIEIKLKRVADLASEAKDKVSNMFTFKAKNNQINKAINETKSISVFFR